MTQQPKQRVAVSKAASAATRARSASVSAHAEPTSVPITAPKSTSSIELNDIAKELDNIITTLPTAKDQALFKDTALSKPLRYVKSQNKPLPKLLKKEKEMELDNIDPDSLNIAKMLVEKEPRRVQVTIILSQFLQCLLWDFDFRFTLLPHQIEAVFAVAGMKVAPLLDEMMKWDDKQLDNLLLMDRRGKGKEARKNMCKQYVVFTKAKGLLLADVMGLGKTVESIAAAVIRNGIFTIKSEETDDESTTSSNLATMIIGPNEAVLNQWEDNLIMSGIDATTIKYFDKNDKNQFKNEKDFILMTRYSLMTETRAVIKGSVSVLFPTLPEQIISELKGVLSSSQKGLGERKKTDQITQILSSNMSLLGNSLEYFRTLIIDEAHMMKNLATYWAVGAGLLAAMSQRNIPLSGTPFIHGPQDMATLMVFIDPSIPSSTKEWWKNAIKIRPGEEIVKVVQQWRRSYFVRREKSLLAKELPTKTVSIKNVGNFKSELASYNEHENAFFDALTASTKMSNEYDDKRDLVNFLFAQLTCMRMSLIHPLLTKGREFTIKFSPSRRDMQVELSRSSTQVCVCCKMGTMSSVDIDGAPLKLVPVPADICNAANTACPHYAHEKCLNLLKSEVNSGCPRCKEFMNLAHIDSKVSYKISHPIYSKHVSVSRDISGFKATSKLQQIVQWVQSIPQEEKAIVYSFFEGSLDLLEGIFVENLEIECARFDDDVDSIVQANELSRFKKSPTCRVLLATVQSSGTGLNIEEANHIAFLDRCFDTAVHRQAEDRCHNLRQKKEVEVTYFDGSMTIDEIMKTLNLVTSTSDTVRLADGTAVGKKEPTIKYDDLAGGINDMMRIVTKEREDYLDKHPENGLVLCKTDLVKVLREKENLVRVQCDGGRGGAVNNPIAEQNVTKPVHSGPLADSSNRGRDQRVAFMSPSVHHQRPPVTPRSSLPAHNYPMPYNYNYLTTLQSPISPSFNHPSFYGFGLPAPVNNGNHFSMGSPYQQGLNYPMQTAQMYANKVPSNRQSFTPTKEYSNIMNSTRNTRNVKK